MIGVQTGCEHVLPCPKNCPPVSRQWQLSVTVQIPLMSQHAPATHPFGRHGLGVHEPLAKKMLGGWQPRAEMLVLHTAVAGSQHAPSGTGGHGSGWHAATIVPPAIWHMPGSMKMHLSQQQHATVDVGHGCSTHGFTGSNVPLSWLQCVSVV